MYESLSSPTCLSRVCIIFLSKGFPSPLSPLVLCEAQLLVTSESLSGARSVPRRQRRAVLATVA